MMVYGPHDESLYVSRAWHLLRGEALGPYDARLLCKLPGMSLWLAGMRLLGIPYILGTLLAFLLAAAYFTAALRACGTGRLLALLAYAILAFNPTSLDHQWYRVMREPVALSLLLVMLASMLHLLRGAGRRTPFLPLWPHALALSTAFAAALLVREEDRLLYVPMAVFAIAFPGLAGGWTWRQALRPAPLAVVLLPVLCAQAAEHGMRAWVERRYGAPLLHDFGEGEFPRLVAAIRGVECARRSRHVMITQERLARLRQAVPSLVPVIDRLPPPGKDTYCASRLGVTEEWTNGWMLFWLKDAAYQAGLTPDLPAAQAFFRQARLDILQAAQEGRFGWKPAGEGLLPPFSWRWSREYLREAAGIAMMMADPPIGLPGPPPPVYGVSADYGRMYQSLTMSHHFDSARQEDNAQELWKGRPEDLYLALRYWLRNPDVAADGHFGPAAGRPGVLGALEHYELHGHIEGRVLREPGATGEAGQPGPLSPWKPWLLDLYGRLAWPLAAAFLVALTLRVFYLTRIPLGAFEWTAIVFLALTLARLAALAHVSVYMGTLDPRLFFSTHVGLLVFGTCTVAAAFNAWRSSRALPPPAAGRPSA